MLYRLLIIILSIAMSGCADTQYTIDNKCRYAGLDPDSPECAVHYLSNYNHNPTDYEDKQNFMVTPSGVANDQFNSDGSDLRFQNEERHE